MTDLDLAAKLRTADGRAELQAVCDAAETAKGWIEYLVAVQPETMRAALRVIEEQAQEIEKHRNTIREQAKELIAKAVDESDM